MWILWIFWYFFSFKKCEHFEVLFSCPGSLCCAKYSRVSMWRSVWPRFVKEQVFCQRNNNIVDARRPAMYMCVLRPPFSPWPLQNCAFILCFVLDHTACTFAIIICKFAFIRITNKLFRVVHEFVEKPYIRNCHLEFSGLTSPDARGIVLEAE